MCPGGAAWCRDYTYDPYGNRAATGQGVDGAVTPTTIGAFTAANNRITAANYDLAGNLTSMAVLASSMTYDANNKMTSFDGANMGFQEVGVYVYDGLGNRVRRVSTIGSSGTVNTTYVYDAFGKLAAEYSDRAPAAADVGTFYRTTDHLGSTRLVTKADGTAKRCYDFYPFGESIPGNLNGRSSEACYGRSEADSFKQKFTGKERDDESDMDYFLARYHSSTMGRFLSPDPLAESSKPFDPQSWNRYAYTGNNPLAFIDPDGLEKLRVTLTTYIPNDKITDPANRIYNANGDGRGNSPLDYKSRQSVLIESDERRRKRPELASHKRAGVTVRYDKDGNTIDVARESGAGLTQNARRNKDGSVNVNFTGSVTNPLGIPLVTPAIDFYINVRCNGGSCAPQFGNHDGFPAYRIEVTGENGSTQEIYNYDPYKIGKSPMSLFPPAECFLPEGCTAEQSSKSGKSQQ